MENLESLPPAEQDEILATLPGIDPPVGTIPNFDNPSNRNDAVIIVMTIGVFLAVVTGSLRLYSRVFTTKIFKLEDCIGLASYAPYIGVIIMQALTTANIGFLVDQWNIHLGTYLDLVFYLYLYRIFYCLVMLLAKTAILLEWTHIFVPDREKKWFFWSSRGMILVNVGAYIIAIILTSVSCIPTQKAWKPWIDGHCFDRRITDILTAWVNLLMDFVILLLPQPIIWKLNMTRKRKIGVSLIFSVGLIVVACASGRIHSNMTLDYHGNTSRDASMNAIWAFGEATGVMIVFSAPAIPKAFSRETFLGGLVLAFQSWTRLKESQASESANSKRSHLWPPTIRGSGRQQQRKPTATELDLMETQLMETQNGDNIELVFDPRSTLSGNRDPNTGIMKTTEVENREDSASKVSTEPILERQHPWMNE